MKRTPFPRKTAPAVRMRDRDPPPLIQMSERIGSTYARTTTQIRPAPKEAVLRSPAYEKAVRTLPCVRCGVIGFTQFCHTDEGKGMGIKTDVRRGWAGCGPHDGKPGCHWLIGTSGQIPRAMRRTLEAWYAQWTRAQVLARGLWPQRLAYWGEDQEGDAT